MSLCTTGKWWAYKWVTVSECVRVSFVSAAFGRGVSSRKEKKNKNQKPNREIYPKLSAKIFSRVREIVVISCWKLTKEKIHCRTTNASQLQIRKKILLEIFCKKNFPYTHSLTHSLPSPTKAKERTSPREKRKEILQKKGKKK